MGLIDVGVAKIDGALVQEKHRVRENRRGAFVYGAYLYLPCLPLFIFVYGV